MCISIKIAAKLIQAGETLWSEIHKLINSIWNKKKLTDQRKESNYCIISQEGR
jgi:hypothetical protein